VAPNLNVSLDQQATEQRKPSGGKVGKAMGKAEKEGWGKGTSSRCWRGITNASCAYIWQQFVCADAFPLRVYIVAIIIAVDRPQQQSHFRPTFPAFPTPP